jgi:putative holliday junction resolvase
MRILAVDPGLKKIGIAISDPSGLVAHALEVFPHDKLEEDARHILTLAERESAALILLGSTHTSGSAATPIARYTHRLMAALRAATDIPVRLADESFSTRAAQTARLERGDGRKARRRADDALAAAAILQEYLDACEET